MTLRERTGMVLRLVVEEYVKGGVPVASDVIAHRAPLKVSSATVRNEMAELEDQGYIHRSYVSAGGIPSDKGYRFYVESILEERKPPEEIQRQVHTKFVQVARNMDAWTQQAAGVMAGLADNMAIVTAPRAIASRFKYIQLVHLQEYMALLIVVLQEARLKQHLLPLTEPTSQQQLTETANRS